MSNNLLCTSIEKLKTKVEEQPDLPPPYEGKTFLCQKCYEGYDINAQVIINKIEYCKPCYFNLTFLKKDNTSILKTTTKL